MHPLNLLQPAVDSSLECISYSDILLRGNTGTQTGGNAMSFTVNSRPKASLPDRNNTEKTRPSHRGQVLFRLPLESLLAGSAAEINAISVVFGFVLS